MQAADRGEAFDVATGLPDSMAREASSVTWYEHACAFADARWPKVAPKGRISLVEGLTAVTPVLVTSQRGAPDAEVLRQAMRRWAFNPARRDMPMPAEVEAALRWLARSSVSVSALQEASVVSRALDACGRKLDGSAAAPEYYRRRRRTFYAALKYAVRERHLSANPLDGADDPEWKAPEISGAVDRRRVASPAQMEKLIAAVATVGQTQGPRLRALFGCMYYGMLRPSEAASLLLDECTLPGRGWGLLEFSEISSASGRDWTDDGAVHQASKPKGGPRNAIRRVPIPPVLVAMLREHVREHGTASDGRLFQTYRGGIYLPSTLWHVLRKARREVFTAAQLASPLVRRPYDFRHAGVSWRLNAGTPAPLVAEWAGHTVEVLLRIYAHCIDGDDERWFGAMEDALGRG
jgi:integrase